MQILITGGAGFIGHNLARTALEAGHSVRILDDLSTGYRRNLDGLQAEFFESSVLENGPLKEAVAGVDSIVHLGALGSVPRSIADPLATHHANATGTLNVLNVAVEQGVEHIVSASSSSVYGLNPALPKKEREWVRPMSPYAVSKLATEQYTLAFQQSFGLNTLAFRFFNVFGPGQQAGHAYAAVIPTWIDSIMRGNPLWVNGDSGISRDFTYVQTVCNVLLRACVERTGNAEPVNLAFGTNTTLQAILDRLAKLADCEIDVRYRDARRGDVPHSQADSSALRRLFPGVTPVSFEDGLAETWDWFVGTESRHA